MPLPASSPRPPAPTSVRCFPATPRSPEGDSVTVVAAELDIAASDASPPCRLLFCPPLRLKDSMESPRNVIPGSLTPPAGTFGTGLGCPSGSPLLLLLAERLSGAACRAWASSSASAGLGVETGEVESLKDSVAREARRAAESAAASAAIEASMAWGHPDAVGGRPAGRHRAQARAGEPRRGLGGVAQLPEDGVADLLLHGGVLVASAGDPLAQEDGTQGRVLGSFAAGLADVADVCKRLAGNVLKHLMQQVHVAVSDLGAVAQRSR
eukprot:scaffold648049_cov46-Prasinocladus_malaysianus.AAC.2